MERDVTPSPSPPSSLNANRGEIKKATGWPPANCPSQTWHTLRECSLREHNPRINPRKTSLSGFYEGREGGKKRRVYVCAPSRRANRSIFVFFRSSPAPPPPPLSSFLFLSLSSSRESRLKEFFLPLRVDAWGLAWKKRKTTTRLWNSTAVQLNPRWHAVRDEKRQQTFTPSPPPLFHEFYNSAYPSSRAGFFFFFLQIWLVKILIQLTQKRVCGLIMRDPRVRVCQDFTSGKIFGKRKPDGSTNPA